MKRKSATGWIGTRISGALLVGAMFGVGVLGCAASPSTGDDRATAATPSTTVAVPSSATAVPSSATAVPSSATAVPSSATAEVSPASRTTADRRVPAVSPAAAAQGFVDVRTVVPDARIELAYATADNFTGQRLYPANARCLVHESLAPGLRTAAAALRGQGLTLVFWDCYRPHSVQQQMFEVVPDPEWVARPGPYSTSHESGRSVDVTLARGKRLLDMGTGFDDFSARAHARATAGVSARAQANRTLLREAMAAGGLTVYSSEWWHFDGPGAGEQRPIIDVPLT